MFEQKIQEWFIKNNKTLSLAESCSGGGIASTLVQIPDCSLYFLGSLVAYSNSAKEKLLNVKKETLEQFGAVSEQTALEMALGAQKAFGSDVAFSVTGVAGPAGGTPDKPVGMVCFAYVNQTQSFSCTMHFAGKRQSIISQATNEALRLICEKTFS